MRFTILAGLSPIYAAGSQALGGLRIQSHSERFFANGANPGGMLTAPGKMSKRKPTGSKRSSRKTIPVAMSVG